MAHRFKTPELGQVESESRTSGTLTKTFTHQEMRAKFKENFIIQMSLKSIRPKYFMLKSVLDFRDYLF